MIFCQKYFRLKQYCTYQESFILYVFEDSIFLLIKRCNGGRLYGSSKHHIYDLFCVILFRLILCTKLPFILMNRMEKSSHGWKAKRKNTRSFRISYYSILSITLVCETRLTKTRDSVITPVFVNMYLQIVQFFQG